MPDISFITINYNTASTTSLCIQSIINSYSNQKYSFEIVVVDNNSNDVEVLKNKILSLNDDRIKFIQNSQNAGFGGGNIIGVNHAGDSKYLAFVNSDTLHTDKNTIEVLIEFMENTIDCGMCSPQGYDGNGNLISSFDYMTHIKKEIFRRWTYHFFNPKKYPKRRTKFIKPTKVDYVQGSFIFMRKKDYKSIGGFDSNIFLYYEEADLAIRLKRKLNKDAYIIPSISYTHFVSLSTPKGIKTKIEQKLSLLYFINKHYGTVHHTILLNYLRVKYAISSIFKKKNRPIFNILIKGAGLEYSMKNY